MTVEDLIEMLKEMPPYAEVEYPSGRDWNYTVDEVELLVHNNFDEENEEWVDTEFVFIS